MTNHDDIIPNTAYIVSKASPCNTFQLHARFHKSKDGCILLHQAYPNFKNKAWLHPDKYSSIQFEFELNHLVHDP